MPKWNAVFILAVIGSGSAADPFSDAILRQLECSQPPSPVPILSVLADGGYIDPKDKIGIDSLSCFEMTKPMSLAGLPVISVCGFEEDKLLRDQRADLFLSCTRYIAGADFIHWDQHINGRSRSVV